jgi:hypothetical protein
MAKGTERIYWTTIKMSPAHLSSISETLAPRLAHTSSASGTRTFSTRLGVRDNG